MVTTLPKPKTNEPSKGGKGDECIAPTSAPNYYAWLHDQTLAWLRDRFECPEATDFPLGIPDDAGECPIARLLSGAGYDWVDVRRPTMRHNVHISYMVDGRLVSVRMPRGLSAFPDHFDALKYPGLIEPACQTEPVLV